MTVAKTDIYFATRKTASAHVHIAKGTGIVRVNNVPIEMMGAESARETVLTPLEIAGDLRQKIDISVRTRGRLCTHHLYWNIVYPDNAYPLQCARVRLQSFLLQNKYQFLRQSFVPPYCY